MATNCQRINLSYPPRPGESEANRDKYIEVGLIDLRSADSIRISYDFDRDGWKIEQSSVFECPAEEAEKNPDWQDWQEVAFIKAWAREKEN